MPACRHQILINVREWDTTGTNIPPFFIGECTNPKCGTSRAFRLFNSPELTLEPGVFNHTPHADSLRKNK
jgi:hypothetical protein